MSQRKLLGAGITSVTPPPAKYAQPHPDATLIAVCDRYVMFEAEWRVLSARLDRGDETLRRALSEFWRVHENGLGFIATTPAVTIDGLRAKARACHAFYDPTPPEEGCEVSAVLWGLLCELAEVSA